MKTIIKNTSIILATSMITPSVFADVTPFVDHYKTNVGGNTTAITNAVVNLLSGYNDLWNTGTTWNNGTPTTLGAPVLRANLQYVADVTTARTAAQETSAYITDRRDQSYSAISGLGNLAAGFRAGSGAFSTIGDAIPEGASTGTYTDKGNGAGLTTSSLGNVVTLVKTLRGSYSSTNPPKAAFNYPRPYRMDAESVVTQTGTETTGFYTSSDSAGNPDTTKPLTYFPTYDTPVVVAPSLLARRGSTPSTDGGFPSGHTNAAYLASFALAYAVPERFASLLLNASNMGEDRILAGMHSPLDVIGGRIEATALAAAILHDTANTTLKGEARNQAKAYFSSDLGTDVPMSQSDWKAGKDLYTERLTYNLPAVGSTADAAVVPKGAEVLLETRFSYLDDAQRREILRSTAIESGSAGADDEGWSRLNLYAASGGYGSFESDVTVTLSDGSDYWRNDISGSGGLTKNGAGSLVLSGTNSYTGDTNVADGTLVVDGEISSSTIIVQQEATLAGSGQVVSVQSNGALSIGNSPGTMTFNGNLILGSTGTSNFEINGLASGNYDLAIAAQLGNQTLSINGGTLNLFFQSDFDTIGSVKIFDFDAYDGTGFDSIVPTGLATGFSASFDSITGIVTVIPEPHSLLLGSFSLLALLVRRSRAC